MSGVANSHLGKVYVDLRSFMDNANNIIKSYNTKTAIKVCACVLAAFSIGVIFGWTKLALMLAGHFAFSSINYHFSKKRYTLLHQIFSSFNVKLESLNKDVKEAINVKPKHLSEYGRFPYTVTYFNMDSFNEVQSRYPKKWFSV